MSLDWKQTYGSTSQKAGIRFASLLAIVGLSFGCGQVGQVDLTENQLPVVVSVEPIELLSQSTRSYSTYGRIEPPRQLQVQSPVSLPLTMIRVVGDQVRKGELLARFDTTQLQQRKSYLQNALSQNPAPEERGGLVQQLNNVNRQLDASTLIAPFDLVIKSSLGMANQPTRIGQVILQVVERGPPRVSTRVPEWIKSKLISNSDYRLYFDGQTVDCKLEFEPLLAGNFETERLVLTQTGLEPGPAENYFQSIRIRFEFPVDSSGFWIPKTALVAGRDGDWNVYVVEKRQTRQGLQNRAIRKPVSVLHIEGPRVFVSGNLLTGNRIISRGIQRIASGQSVIVATTSGGSDRNTGPKVEAG